MIFLIFDLVRFGFVLSSQLRQPSASLPRSLFYWMSRNAEGIIIYLFTVKNMSQIEY